MKKIVCFFKNIKQLLAREFGFIRHHEITGHSLKKKNESTGLYENHVYRGFTLWLKEIVESAMAIFMIGYFIYRAIDITLFQHCNLSELEGYANEFLKLSGIVLIADSLLLISALISSPGIDETIDSISVSLAGVFLLLLAPFAYDNKNPNKETLYQILLPIALIILFLILAKHFLKWFNNKYGY
jgi:hypothetical protein